MRTIQPVHIPLEQLEVGDVVLPPFSEGKYQEVVAIEDDFGPQVRITFRPIATHQEMHTREHSRFLRVEPA